MLQGFRDGNNDLATVFTASTSFLTVELESKVAGSGPEAPAGTEVNYTAMTNEEKDELGSKIEQALQEFFEPYIIK